MIIVLLGSPGAGKGTQAKIASERYGLKHLATGDIFRSEMEAKTELGEKAAEFVKAGRLVPDSIVCKMVAAKIDLKSGTKYLLDGFPRNLEQAQTLDSILAPRKASVSLVAFLNLPRAEALRRLVSRRVCKVCGEVYNIDMRPPSADGKCEKCGGAVVQREDDAAATAERRLMVFEDITRPLVAYYKAESVFSEINAVAGVSEVAAALAAVIEPILDRKVKA